MSYRKLAGVAAVVALFAAGCGEEDPGHTVAPGGTGGIVGNPGGSGGGGSGGTGGTGGTGGVPHVPHCGDGVVEGDEVCDDGEDNSDNAPDACRTNCTEARCGDSVEDTGETCDDGNQASGDGCSASCQLEFSCGDGLREFTEECDGEDLAGQTCADFGHNSGALACATDCTFDSAACATVEICDNGVDDDGDLAADCEDTDCASDIVACPTCGDGVINVDGEDCDGTALDGATCTSLGFASGTISCSSVCILDTTACVAFEDCDTPGDEDGNGFADCEDPTCSELFACPTCGNGIMQQGEQCEGAPPPQANCFDNGFDTGTMSCDPVTCQISTANCRNYYCGDAAVEGPEECDDGNNVTGDGCTNCMRDGDSCSNPLIISDATHRDPTTGVWTFAGSTANMSRKFVAPTCNSTQAEPEAVVKFTAPHGGEFRIDMDTVYDDLFYVWDGACGIGSPEIACMDTGSQTISLAQGQEIFIIATGYGSANGDTGPFTLIITPTTICGDGIREGGEYCDFGDALPGDGCSGACKLEAGWECNATSCWQTTCGDGVREGTEGCDDGNTTPNDGCTACVPDGNTCANPLIVTPSYRNPATGIWTINASTAAMTPNFAATTCGSSAGQRDMVLEFTAPAAGVYNFDLEFVPFMDEMLYIRDGACATGTEVLCNDDPGIGNLTMTAGQTVYIVVDGYGSSSPTNHGPFRLLITPPIACGDGFTNGSETCDTGTNVDPACVSCQVQAGYACNATSCWPTVCGDGVREGAEACDDGNTTAGDGCTNCFPDGDTCANPLVIGPQHIDPVTGFWVFHGDTTPFAKTFSASCTSSFTERDAVLQFTAPRAGTYLVDYQVGYDGVIFAFDGVCDPNGFQIACSDPEELTLNLTAGQTVFIVADGWGSASDDDYGPFTMVIEPPPVCGDGVIGRGETCDTGTAADPGCSSCQLQPGYACNASGCWTTTCGDGVLEGFESCEDGNQVPNDGCTNCLVDGDSCANPFVIDSTHLDTTTGIWTFAGNTAPLSRSFTAPSCNTTNAEPEAVVKFTAPHTGNFTIDMLTVSPYDDLFYVWNGACGIGSPEIACMDTGSQSVSLVLGQDIYIVATGYGSADDDFGPFTLTLTPTTVCGNGVLEANEYCDFGDIAPGDGCSAHCQLEIGWACDAASCWQTICGDGTVEGTEQCDDLNTTPGDGCDATCMIEVVAEVEPNGTIATATPLGLTDLGFGAVSPAMESDYWAIPAVAGTTYTIEVSRGVDGSCGTTFPYDDPAMELYDPTGAFLDDDDDDGQGYCPLITFTAGMTGTYYANVTSGSWDSAVPTYYIWVY